MEMAGEHWRVINLRAISREGEDDPIGRRPGEALWPARFPLEALGKLRGAMGQYDWSALYDGEPIPPGGELIDRGDFKFADHVPDGMTWVRFWDFAVSDTSGANQTASVGMAIDKDEGVYIRSPIHGRWQWPQARKVILTACKIDGPAVAVGGEDAGQQRALIDDLNSDRRFRPYSIFPYSVATSKRIRALPWIARLEAGRVNLVGTRGWTYFLDCCQSFTGVGDEEDDLIDAVSGAYQMLVGPKPKKKRKKVYVGRW